MKQHHTDKQQSNSRSSMPSPSSSSPSAWGLATQASATPASHNRNNNNNTAPPPIIFNLANLSSSPADQQHQQLQQHHLQQQQAINASQAAVSQLQNMSTPSSMAPMQLLGTGPSANNTQHLQAATNAKLSSADPNNLTSHFASFNAASNLSMKTSAHSQASHSALASAIALQSLNQSQLQHQQRNNHQQQLAHLQLQHQQLQSSLNHQKLLLSAANNNNGPNNINSSSNSSPSSLSSLSQLNSSPMPKLGVTSTTSSDHHNHNHLALLNNNNINTNQQAMDSNLEYIAKIQQQQQLFTNFGSMHPLSWQQQNLNMNQQQQQRLQQEQAVSSANSKWFNGSNNLYTNATPTPYSPFRPPSLSSNNNTTTSSSSATTNANNPPIPVSNMNNNNSHNFNNHNNNMIGQNGDNSLVNNNGVPLKLRFDSPRNSATNHPSLIDSNMSIQSIDPKNMNLPPNIRPGFQIPDSLKSSPLSLMDSYKLQSQRINEELEKNSERLSLFTYNLLSNCIPGTNKTKKIVPSNSIEDLRQSIYVGEFYMKFEELAIGILTNQVIIPDFSIIDYMRRDKLSIQELTKMETVHQRLGLTNILCLFDLTQKLHLQRNGDIKTTSHQDILFNSNLDVGLGNLQQHPSFNQPQVPKTSSFLPLMSGKSETTSMVGNERNRRSSSSPSDNPTRSQSTNGTYSRLMTAPSPSHLAGPGKYPSNQPHPMQSMPVNPPPRQNTHHSLSKCPPPPPVISNHTSIQPHRSASAFGGIGQQKSSGISRPPPAAHQSSSVRPNMIASSMNLSNAHSSSVPVTAHLSSKVSQIPKLPLHDTLTPTNIKPSPESNNSSPFRSTLPLQNQSNFSIDGKMSMDTATSMPTLNLLGLKTPDLMNRTDTLLKKGDLFVNPSGNYVDSNMPVMQKSNSYASRSPGGIDTKIGSNPQIPANGSHLPTSLGNLYPIGTYVSNNPMLHDPNRNQLNRSVDVEPTSRALLNNNQMMSEEQLEEYTSLMNSLANQQQPLQQVSPVQNQPHLPSQQTVDLQNQSISIPSQLSQLQSQTLLQQQHLSLVQPPQEQTQPPQPPQPPQIQPLQTTPHIPHVLQEHNQTPGLNKPKDEAAVDNPLLEQTEREKQEKQQMLKSPDLTAQHVISKDSLNETKQDNLVENVKAVSSKSDVDCNIPNLPAGVTTPKINSANSSVIESPPKPNCYPKLKKAWLINYDQEEDKAAKSTLKSSSEVPEMAVKIKSDKKAPVEQMVADPKISSKSSKEKNAKKLKSETNKKQAKVVNNSAKRKTSQTQQPPHQQTTTRNSRANKISYNESEMSVASTSELDSDDTSSPRPKHKRLRRMPKRKVKPSSDKEKDQDKKSDATDQPSPKSNKNNTNSSHSSSESKKSGTKKFKGEEDEEEEFLQIEPCYEIVQKSIRCLECRRVRVPNPKSDKTPNTKQTTKTNWDDFCRFYEFRKLKINSSGNIVTAGFSNLNDAKEEDKLLCLPNNNQVPEDFTHEIATYILKNIGDEFDKIVMQERAALELYKKEHKNDTRTNWKRTVSGLRELCDVCSTTLFNRHFVCESCGFVVCIDCYRERSGNVASSSKKDCTKSENEMSVDDASSTEPKDSTSETTDQPSTSSSSKKSKKDQFGWIYCTRNELHSHEKLVLTQIIAGDCLEELWTMLRNYRLSQQVTDVIEECISLLPCDHEVKKSSIEVNNNDSDSNTHSWLIDGDLLVLSNARHEKNMELFRQQWRQGKPVLVRGVHKLMKIKMWLPQFFGKEFGDYRSDLVDCRNGDIHRHSMKKYWENFEPSGSSVNSKKKIKDEGIHFPAPSANNEELSNGPSYYSGSALWRLKDWPPGQDFYEILPAHYEDFMNNLPLEEYTTRCGKLNLALRLPKEMLKPDLGPKMYSAYGTTKLPDRGTTNIHLDISDAINVMVYVSGATALNNGSEELRDIFDKTIDECPTDEKMKQQIREKKLIPGALWHIFKPSDTQKMREFLNKVADERNISIEKRNDPIHDQTWYLDEVLLNRLYKEYRVKSYAILQCMGDAILIPAGAPHQVKNLQNCIKVANDFVSPENVSSCLQLTHEFRSLPETHINQEDKLQIKNILYHSVKESLQYLNCEKLYE